MQNLDERLAEVDRKLRSIQAELMPGREPNSPPEPTEPSRRGRDGPLATLLEQTANHRSDDATTPETDRVDQLTELHARLLASMTEVLDGFRRALAEMNEHGHEATMSAGPFATLEALRGFERELEGLTSVAEVELRGYEGEDRAVIAVRLAPPTAPPPTT